MTQRIDLDYKADPFQSWSWGQFKLQEPAQLTSVNHSGHVIHSSALNPNEKIQFEIIFFFQWKK